MSGGRALHRGGPDTYFILPRRARPGHGPVLIADAGRPGTGDPDLLCRAAGTPAGAIAERDAVRPEFTSGVIDRPLLKALLGEDPVVLCSTAMLDHVRGRVTEFEARTRLPVQVRDLLGGTR